MPTHCGRNGRIFTTEGVLQIRNKKWEDCFEPLDANINNYISQTYTKSYVHHLFKSRELLGYQIASIQNLAFYMWVIEKTRENIKNNSLQEWIREIEDIMI
jgi:queuine tRNA-ribosyltransferase